MTAPTADLHDLDWAVAVRAEDMHGRAPGAAAVGFGLVPSISDASPAVEESVRTPMPLARGLPGGRRVRPGHRRLHGRHPARPVRRRRLPQPGPATRRPATTSRPSPTTRRPSAWTLSRPTPTSSEATLISPGTSSTGPSPTTAGRLRSTRAWPWPNHRILADTSGSGDAGRKSGNNLVTVRQAATRPLSSSRPQGYNPPTPSADPGSGGNRPVEGPNASGRR
jgi:hypothetical protein